MTVFSVTGDGVSLSAGTTKTIVELAPGGAFTDDAKIRVWVISFKGTSTTGTPVKVELGRSDTAVTASSLTPIKRDPNNQQSSTLTARSAPSSEAGSVTVLEVHRVHPQGHIHRQYSEDQQWLVEHQGYPIRVRCTADEAVTCAFYLEWEE